jgi:prepilin-type N-terminal cleavage/methylation domain-containing protein
VAAEKLDIRPIANQKPKGKDMKRKYNGFTMVELLTVVAVISLLLAILIPSLQMVRRIAKETQQKAQFTTIDLALTAFKSDYGNYPPSVQRDIIGDHYCGAQRLAEALVGWDLLGFHPKSAWRADGFDSNGDPEGTYDPGKTRNDDNDNVPDTLHERRGPYLELATANVFRLGSDLGMQNGLFENVVRLNPERYVVCDVFGVKNVITTQPGVSTATFRAGTPILYYRANTASKIFHDGPTRYRIYDKDDNIVLIELYQLKKLPDVVEPHKLAENEGRYLYDPRYKLVDPKVSALMAPGVYWPYRPDSYILISAGMDGEYGTQDDITNFGN